MGRRFPRSVYDHGGEPDARFSMANERTFLAWITFGLGAISLGVGLESFALALDHRFRTSASLVLIAFGTLTPLLAWREWRQVERALRCGDPLPSSVQVPLTVAVVALAGVLVLLGVVLR